MKIEIGSSRKAHPFILVAKSLMCCRTNREAHQARAARCQTPTVHAVFIISSARRATFATSPCCATCCWARPRLPWRHEMPIWGEKERHRKTDLGRCKVGFLGRCSFPFRFFSVSVPKALPQIRFKDAPSISGALHLLPWAPGMRIACVRCW